MASQRLLGIRRLNALNRLEAVAETLATQHAIDIPVSESWKMSRKYDQDVVFCYRLERAADIAEAALAVQYGPTPEPTPSVSSSKRKAA